MQRAARVLIGEHDFTTFRSAACQSRSPYRCIFSIAVRRFDDLVVLDVTANAFLHHMVRNIAAALMQVGAGDSDRRVDRRCLGRARSCTRGSHGAADGSLSRRLSSTAPNSCFRVARAPMILKAAGDVW